MERERATITNEAMNIMFPSCSNANVMLFNFTGIKQPPLPLLLLLHVKIQAFTFPAQTTDSWKREIMKIVK